MARARRAKPRPSRYVIPVVVALLLIGGVILAVHRSSGGGTAAAPAADPTVLASQQTASADPSGSATGTEASAGSSADSSPGAGSESASPSGGGSESESPSGAGSGSAQPTASGATSSAATNGGAAAAQVLAPCRAKVRSGDAVLATAKVGVGHWADHVKAQTDANKGTISVAAMDAIFKRTRLLGPGDVSRYTKAVQAHDAEQGSCVS